MVKGMGRQNEMFSHTGIVSGGRMTCAKRKKKVLEIMVVTKEIKVPSKHLHSLL